MKQFALLFFFAIVATPATFAHASDNETTTQAEEQPEAITPAQVQAMIQRLRKQQQDGLLAEFAGTDLNDGQKSQAVRILIASDKFSAIQLKKLDVVMGLVSCMENKPSQPGKIKASCMTNQRVEQLLRQGRLLMEMEAQQVKQAAADVK